MADISWMLEQKYRSRTAELLAAFRNTVSGDVGELTLPQLDSLQGVAKNTVHLLRENKTRCVRHEQAAADPASPAVAEYGAADFAGVKREIDAAIDEVLAKKAELSHARVRLLSSQPTPVEHIDLTDQLRVLLDLRNQGVLTDAEFDRAKNKLL